MDSAALDTMIARLRAMPDVRARVAKHMAESLSATIRENIAAQRDPNGASWPATESGAPALQGAAKALAVSVSENGVSFRFGEPYSLHHFGAVRGGKRRKLLPTGGSQIVTNAFDAAARAAFAEAMAVTK